MIHIRKKKGYYTFDATNYIGIEPKYFGITKKDLLEYFKKHPMPTDPAYTKENLISDLTGASGVYVLPDDIKLETVKYIENLVNKLLSQKQ